MQTKQNKRVNHVFWIRWQYMSVCNHSLTHEYLEHILWILINMIVSKTTSCNCYKIFSKITLETFTCPTCLIYPTFQFQMTLHTILLSILCLFLIYQSNVRPKCHRNWSQNIYLWSNATLLFNPRKGPAQCLPVTVFTSTTLKGISKFTSWMIKLWLVSCRGVCVITCAYQSNKLLMPIPWLASLSKHTLVYNQSMALFVFLIAFDHLA